MNQQCNAVTLTGQIERIKIRQHNINKLMRVSVSDIVGGCIAAPCAQLSTKHREAPPNGPGVIDYPGAPANQPYAATSSVYT